MNCTKTSQTMDGELREEEESVALITRACDMCRKKKIRCDVVADTCAQCIKYKTPCHFTPISMKRNPRRPPRDKHIQELERRLKRMEDQLKRTVAQPPRSECQVENPLELPEATGSDQSYTERYHNWHAGVETCLDEAGEAAEIVIQQVDSSQHFQKTACTQSSGYSLASSSLWRDASGRDISFHPLPPIDKGLALIQKSFRGFNSAFPIFDQNVFLLKYQNPESNMNDICWWACLNIVLALSHRFTGTKISEKQQDQEAWGYFENALKVNNKLIMTEPSIQSIQALIGLALIFLGTPNQSPVMLLISSAIKSAQRMDLHRSYKHSTLQDLEIEQRKRIFWSAYTIDKDLSLTTGQPPTQDDDDMDVELPLESNSENIDAFYIRIKLAIIQGQIYKTLCSVRSRRQPAAERVMAARKLETMLQSWKANIPTRFFQEPSGLAHDEVYSMILQLSYFKSLSTVYSSLPVFPMYSELQVPQHPDITYEARKAIRLLEITPRRSHACLWAVFPIYVTASTTLLTYTLSQPSNESAITDLQLSLPLLRLLVTLARISKGQREEVADMYRFSIELFQKAKMAIESSNLDLCQSNQSQDQSRGASKSQKESVEDFLGRMESLSAGYEHFDLNLLSPTSLEWIESHNKPR